MAEGSSLPGKPAQLPGFPENFQVINFNGFTGLNTKPTRPAIEDQEMYWCHNFMPLGTSNLRTLYDVDVPYYIPPMGKTILHYDFCNVADIPYVFVFLSDGSAQALRAPIPLPTPGTYSPITVAPASTFDTSVLPDIANWGSLYVLIIANNGYFIWDGTILYSPGSLAPGVTLTSGGSGYTSAPTVIAVGGSGSGATFTATVSGGAVTAVTMTNAGSGYVAGDQPVLQFSGGGAHTPATATVALATGGSIASVVVTAGGSSYSSGVTASTSGGGGSGATFTVQGSAGVITSIGVNTPGSGFTSTPTMVITDGTGSGAAAVAILSSGGLGAVTIVTGGTGYVGTPGVTFVGGGGSGAFGIASVSSGVVTGVTVTNPGGGYTSAPTVVFNDTANDTASGLISIMPIGLTGTSIETFAQRVWVANGPNVFGSAPGSVSDFGVPDGGIGFTSTDFFLKSKFSALRQSNGFLYLVAENSSVNYIAGVTTSGNPPTTTFTNQNIDPQIGSSWGKTTAVYSRAVTFVNPYGIHVIYGGAVEKVSSPLDGLLNSEYLLAQTTKVNPFNPSSAVAIIYGIHVYMVLLPITNPITKETQNALMMWDGKKWWTAAPSISLKEVRTQEDSSSLLAWGSTGTALYPLFQKASTAITKTVQSKMWDTPSYIYTKHTTRVFGLLQNASSAAVDLQISLDSDTSSQSLDISNIFAINWTNNAGNNVTWTNAAGATILWTVQGRVWFVAGADVSGVLIGLTLSSTSEDFTLLSIILGVQDYTPNV